MGWNDRHAYDEYDECYEKEDSAAMQEAIYAREANLIYNGTEWTSRQNTTEYKKEWIENLLKGFKL